MTDADPEFLALTTRQQRQIDRVFDRATRPANNGPPKKKRRLTPPIDVGGGGFEDDGEGEGGFMDAGGFDPDEGGGFISDEGGGGGGFMDEDIEEEPRQTSASNTTSTEDEPRRIPLRNLPAALSSLNLPSDEDVLAVFRASASGWTEQTGRYRDKDEEEENRLMGGGVELKDFRAVCAALMGPDEGGEQVSDEEEEGDMYQDEDGESSLSEITEDEYNEPTPTTTTGKGKGKGKGKGTGNGRGKKKVELEDNGKIKLNPRQREVVNDLWEMLKPDSGKEVRGGHILGRDEVRRKVRDLGEMWTEEEVSCLLMFSGPRS